MGETMTIGQAAGRDPGNGSDSRAQRGQQILLLMGAFGHQANEALVEQFGNPDAVGNSQVLVICELALRGPLRPKDLQADAALTSGGTTKLLDRLEVLGLIERAYGRVAGDRRGIVVSLTPEGHRAAAAMSAAIEGRIDAVRVFATELLALLEE